MGRQGYADLPSETFGGGQPAMSFQNHLSDRTHRQRAPPAGEQGYDITSQFLTLPYLQRKCKHFFLFLQIFSLENFSFGTSVIFLMLLRPTTGYAIFKIQRGKPQAATQ